MKNCYPIHPFIRAILVVVAAFLSFSCNQNKQQPDIVKEVIRITPPQVTIVANLPDSSQPKVTLLSEMPKPTIKLNGKPGKTHPFIDSLTGLPQAPEVQGTGFFTTYTTDNGLVGDIIGCSTIDKTGALWFGSNGWGVSKYDGKTFTTYSIAQGLAFNLVRSILEDKKGNMWFGTGGGGVSKYDGKTFTTYTTAQGLASNNVLSIIEDKKGNLWFGTHGGGVSKYDGKTFITYNTSQGLTSNGVYSIIEDKNGNLWISTDVGGVSKYDGKTFTNFTTKQGLAANDIRPILEDKNGNLWFGTIGGGVSKYDGKTFTTYTITQGLANNSVSTILEDKAGNLWFGTITGGVSKYDGKTFTNFTTKQGLAANDVNDIIEDKAGNLWFSTRGGGVSKYGGKHLMSFTTAHGLGNNIVSSITEDKTGNLWFCTGYGGVSKYDGKSLATYIKAPGLSNDNVTESIADKSGNLWFGTAGGGITKFDGTTFTTYTTDQGLTNNYVYSIIEDKRGNLWIGTKGGGLSKFDGKTFTNYTIDQGLASINIYFIIEDKAGNLWIGTDDGGVSKFDGKSFTNYTTDQGLASNGVNGILEDSQGNLWVCSDLGLSVMPSIFFKKGAKNTGNIAMKEPLFQVFTTKNGLPDNAISGIFEDKEGKLLVGSNSGIAILKEGIRSFGKKGAIELYSSASGYPVKSVFSLLFSDSKGIIWIPTSSVKTGLVRFDYNAIHKTKHTPVLVLQNVKINNEPIGWNTLLSSKREKPPMKEDSLTTPPAVTEEIAAFGKVLNESDRETMQTKFAEVSFDSIAPWYPVPQHLVLPYQHNSISFEFNAIETSRNFMVKYQYKLEGYDEDWSVLTGQTSATFGNMYEGNYTFKVKALSPEGVWSKPITYAFTVLPPWWRTWWAYGLYLVAFVASLWGFTYYRSRQLRKEKRLLEHKVAIRTAEVVKQKEEIQEINQELSQQKEEIAAQRDQVNQTLTHLKATQTQLIQKEKMASLGELTAGIAHEIQNPLNFVNNFSEVNKELIEELEGEIDKGNMEEIKSLVNDIKENEQKVILHGKRADSIVKGMLEHARASSGERQPTDINAIADEYLRLSYHGLRAKDKDFNANFTTDFDVQLPKLEVVPQEIGRVLLNLFNNAFYAVNQKKKQLNGQYKPEVRVITKVVGNKIEITVKDNGNGIPESIKQKIFQPFFTTKPTGEGTGLGLSLSYDIITKVHGGELKVESKEGEFTEMIIIIPSTKA